MTELILEYPVTTVDGRRILPAGTALTDAALGRVAARAPAAKEAACLLEFGSVRRDLMDFLSHPPYQHVFSGPGTIARLLDTVAAIHLTHPCLDCLVYFRESDDYTYRHLLTVLALTARLAHELIPDSEDRVREAFASPTHDIGKICVPLEILRKNTPLSHTERRQLGHHTLAGAVLLSYFLADHRHFAVKVARDHHERKDGSGYPRGIRDIDPLLEIIIVSDIYDALLSPRPYRAVSFDNRTAIEEITSMAERHEIGWYVVKALVAHNRKVPFRVDDIWVSSEKRGLPPPGNLYGETVDE